MNIAFDSTAICGPMSKNRGIGNYALSQFKMMIERDKNNSYFFLNFYDDFKLTDLVTYGNLEEHYFYCGKDNFLLTNEGYKELIGDVIKNFIIENNIDVFYITSPFEAHVPIYEKSWFNGIKTIATVYDIIPCVFKDEYLSNKDGFDWYMSCVNMLRWVDKYFVISQSVKDDMIQYLQFNADKIEVIWGACDYLYRKVVINDEEKDKLFSKFGIVNKYVMCTGGDDSRKNIKELIVAFSRMSKELIGEYQLVIVCKLSDKSVELYTELSKQCLIFERVILTNFISQDDLLKLYNLAFLVAFPSKYEGFGLPVLEAYACGTPVLTSNNSSLVQIAQGAAVLVDPFSVEDITRGLVEALTNTDLDLLVKKGYERLKHFQWDIVADSAIESINGISINYHNNTKQGKKKIAFFTPLPPIESGISDYSVDILNGISKYFDIDVFIDDKYKPTCILNENISVYNHKKFKMKHKKYYDIIYQMGNSLYHEYMYSYIHKYNGTLVLHDYNMHTVLQAIAFKKNKSNQNFYREYLLEDLNENEIDEYFNNSNNEQSSSILYKIELNGYVTNYVRKIVVHSDYAKEKLLQRNINRNVRKIYSYAKIESLVDAKLIKKKNNIDSNEIVIASFGHIHETKRVIPILNAFTQICRKYDNIRYVFVGKLAPELKEEFDKFLIDNLEIKEKVTVTGYTDIHLFKDYIDLADICVNLRYPYNGETSGSLMRILAKGKCVIVNNIGSFSELPDNCCLKLPSVDTISNNEEIDSIYNAIEYFISDASKRENYSKNARTFAENNLDIDIIAKQYAYFIDEILSPSLNEQMLSNIKKYEVEEKKYSLDETAKLSKTLAYSKK